MIEAARRSAIDEMRHARGMRALASRYSAAPALVKRRAIEPRSLQGMAVDNAMEGCVREAYAALVAAHQAESARDPLARELFASIAKDEARHALLSFAVHDWALDHARACDSRDLENARHEACEALMPEAAIEPESPLRIMLGLPDAERAVDFARALA